MLAKDDPAPGAGEEPGTPTFTPPGMRRVTSIIKKTMTCLVPDLGPGRPSKSERVVKIITAKCTAKIAEDAA